MEERKKEENKKVSSQPGQSMLRPRGMQADRPARRRAVSQRAGLVLGSSKYTAKWRDKVGDYLISPQQRVSEDSRASCPKIPNWTRGQVVALRKWNTRIGPSISKHESEQVEGGKRGGKKERKKGEHEGWSIIRQATARPPPDLFTPAARADRLAPGTRSRSGRSVPRAPTKNPYILHDVILVIAIH
ncbi:hypothetical protein BO78DRAFT_230649 [Aspergillus sclerotiicarbonarius CBS 121057]|uniref:Uncharacterized protein n=1 Tax=Aspergillus sclerotiicarbonarius (strain CBS 121057 / IBT 28362) TaxID=1448318 RepID=A0A319DWD4_ASPSB|nr:hypothetical protein BO78DRAFT_230649 [Aspergillus sclerotiicarbonarius CBS 121057]